MMQVQILGVVGDKYNTTGGLKIPIGNAQHNINSWAWCDGDFLLGGQQYSSRVPYIPSKDVGFFDVLGRSGTVYLRYNTIKSNGDVQWDDDPIAFDIPSNHYYNGFAYTLDYIFLVTCGSKSLTYTKINLSSMSKEVNTITTNDLDANYISSLKVVGIENENLKFQIFTNMINENRTEIEPIIAYIEFVGSQWVVKNKKNYNEVKREIESSIVNNTDDETMFNIVEDNMVETITNSSENSFKWCTSEANSVKIETYGSYVFNGEKQQILKSISNAVLESREFYDDKQGTILNSANVEIKSLYVMSDTKTSSPVVITVNHSIDNWDPYYICDYYVAGGSYSPFPPGVAVPYGDAAPSIGADVTAYKKVLPTNKIYTTTRHVVDPTIEYVANISNDGEILEYVNIKQGIPKAAQFSREDYFEFETGLKNAISIDTVDNKSQLPEEGDTSGRYRVLRDETYHNLTTTYYYSEDKEWVLVGCYFDKNYNRIINDHNPPSPSLSLYREADLRFFDIDATVAAYVVKERQVDRKTGMKTVNELPNSTSNDWTDTHLLNNGYKLVFNKKSNKVEGKLLKGDTVVISAIPQNMLSENSIGDIDSRCYYVIESGKFLLLNASMYGITYKYDTDSKEFTILFGSGNSITRFTELIKISKAKAKVLKKNIVDLL